jgi:transcriptional regulator with XRE-family HTH domain
MERPNTSPMLSDINLQEIARRSGISVGYLSLILKGKRKNVSLSIVTRLAFTLNLPVEEVKDWILMTSEESQNIESKGEKYEAQTETQRRKEWDEEVQDLILRILKSLEKFDALQLKELMSEAERFPTQIPLKSKLIEWIEGILAGQNSQFNQALDHFMRARTLEQGSPMKNACLQKSTVRWVAVIRR